MYKNSIKFFNWTIVEPFEVCRASHVINNSNCHSLKMGIVRHMKLRAFVPHN